MSQKANPPPFRTPATSVFPSGLKAMLVTSFVGGSGGFTPPGGSSVAFPAHRLPVFRSNTTTPPASLCPYLAVNPTASKVSSRLIARQLGLPSSTTKSDVNRLPFESQTRTLPLFSPVDIASNRPSFKNRTSLDAVVGCTNRSRAGCALTARNSTSRDSKDGYVRIASAASSIPTSNCVSSRLLAIVAI